MAADKNQFRFIQRFNLDDNIEILIINSMCNTINISTMMLSSLF